MSTYPLFDYLPARRTDPASSHGAAADLLASGAISRQRREVLDALRLHGPATSRELAARSGLDRYAVARRLPELARAGLAVAGEIRECTAGGRPGVEWRAKA